MITKHCEKHFRWTGPQNLDITQTGTSEGFFEHPSRTNDPGPTPTQNRGVCCRGHK